MTELMILKMEACKLFEQVDQLATFNSNGKKEKPAAWETEKIYADAYFKEQLKSIRKRYYSISSKKIATHSND